VLDPSTLTWKALGPRLPILSNSDEDSWVLMPNNTIAGPSCMNPPKPGCTTYPQTSGIGETTCL
jgi:hypothetical protein